jgi:hypothetical protein
LYGVGLGLVLSQINNLTLSSVPVRDAGEASGVTNTFRQIGSSLGAAIIGAILLNVILGGLQNANIPPQQRAAVQQILNREKSSIAFGSAETFASLPPPVRAQLTAYRREATTRGIRAALLVGAGFMILAMFVSKWLPLRAQNTTED